MRALQGRVAWHLDDVKTCNLQCSYAATTYAVTTQQRRHFVYWHMWGHDWVRFIQGNHKLVVALYLVYMHVPPQMSILEYLIFQYLKGVCYRLFDPRQVWLEFVHCVSSKVELLSDPTSLGFTLGATGTVGHVLLDCTFYVKIWCLSWCADFQAHCFKLFDILEWYTTFNIRLGWHGFLPVGLGLFPTV